MSPKPSQKLNRFVSFIMKRAADGLARAGLLRVVVHQVEIAQRVMDEIEADVGADLMRVGVVLEERVERCAPVKAYTKRAADQVGRELAVRQRHIVAE